MSTMSAQMIYRNPTHEDQSSTGLVYQLPGENIGKPLPELLFRIRQQSSFHHSFIFTLKASLGVGVLVLPYTFRLLGILGAILCLVVTAISVIYCMDSMMSSMYTVAVRLNKRVIPYNYAYKLILYNGSERVRCFSYWGEHAVDFFLMASQIGICSVHLAFTCEVSHQILYEYLPFDILWHVLIQSFVYVVLIALLRSFRTLFYVSIIGNCLAIVGLLSIIADVVMSSSPKDIQLFGDNLLYNLPVCYAIYLFALVSIGVAATITERECTMRRRGRALKINFLCLTFLYVTFGSLGYLFYGENVRPLLLKNLRPSMFTTCTISTYTLSVMLTIPLQVYPATNSVLEYFYKTYGLPDNVKICALDRRAILSYTVQICVVIFSAQMLMLLKDVHNLASLVGSLFIVPGCIILPCIMKCVLSFPIGRNSIRKLIFNVIFILIGLYVICLGGSYNIMLIFHASINK